MRAKSIPGCLAVVRRALRIGGGARTAVGKARG